MCRLRFILHAVFALLLFSFLQNVCAQENLITSEYAYRHYTTDDGLPSYSLETIYQDSRGFIWVGCTGGIARYDGFTFHRYMEGEFSNIVRISENSQHEIIAYGFTLNTIDRNTDTVRSLKFPKGYYVYKNNHGDFPAGYFLLNKSYSKTKALFQLTDTGFVKRVEHPDFEKTDLFSGRLFVDEEHDRIYVPMSDGISILSLSGERLALYPGYYAYNFIRYRDTVWFVASDGIYRFDHDVIEKMISIDAQHDVSIMKLCVDANGALLFCDNFSVYRLLNEQIETLFTGVNQITDMLVDSEGNLWIATYQGLYNLFLLQFKNYWLKNRSDVVRGVVTDVNNQKIIGSYNGELIRFNDDSSANIAYPSNEYGNSFSAYFMEKQGSLFLPGNGKILKISGRQSHWLNLPVQSYDFAYALSDGTVAVGGMDGIHLISAEGNIVKTFPMDTLLQAIHSNIAEDRQGNGWCGGAHGITIVAKDTIKRVSGDLLQPCLVFANDNEGNVWLAAENRLFRAMGDSVELMHTFRNAIETIFFTRNNKLIVGTSNAINISDTALNHIVVYDHLNGFTGKEVMRAGISEDEEGRVWLPSVTSLVSFNPDELLTRQPVPKLYILSLSSSPDNVNWQKEDLEAPRLTHEKKNLRFSYIGLSYSAAQNVRYRYRLVGFQDDWSRPVADRELNFNNLKPGKYIFELKANAGTPETQTETVSLPVYIKPAFWQTLLFKILVFALFVGIIACLAIRYQRRRHEKEIRKANREKEMNELRVQSVRLKSIPHFNSNVLAGIEYFIMTKSKEEANELLTTYSRFTNITLHDIDKAQRPLKDELEYVSMYLELEKMRYGDKLSYDIDVDSDVRQDIMIPNMVLHTYAENAVKHGIRGKNMAGKVTISIKNEDKGVRISVEDDGVGRAVSEEKNRQQNRVGQGLSILSRQIALYNQQNSEKIEEKVVDLRDEQGNAAGTRFELYVPYHYEYI
ncbi:MAG: two-component regulator propeller domain-containing protein [Bacteroidota bacterium]|nr:two-component regulator propeller domain-containing protein [Bacteroidota bacterium]